MPRSGDRRSKENAIGDEREVPLGLINFGVLLPPLTGLAMLRRRTNRGLTPLAIDGRRSAADNIEPKLQHRLGPRRRARSRSSSSGRCPSPWPPPSCPRDLTPSSSGRIDMTRFPEHAVPTFLARAGHGAFQCEFFRAPTMLCTIVARQAEHHRTRTFQEEFREFLDRHGIEYDERYLWD